MAGGGALRRGGISSIFSKDPAYKKKKRENEMSNTRCVKIGEVINCFPAGLSLLCQGNSGAQCSPIMFSLESSTSRPLLRKVVIERGAGGGSYLRYVCHMYLMIGLLNNVQLCKDSLYKRDIRYSGDPSLKYQVQ